MLIVFDLDGTLADDAHRQHHIAGEDRDWGAYFSECGGDQAIEPIVEVSYSLHRRDNCRVEIWTGRPEEYRALTEAWLDTHAIRYHELRMRPTGDFRSDVEVKGEWLAECVERPSLVFDDRTRTVAWWRQQDIICCQVADHDY